MPSRLTAPTSLEAAVTHDPYERALHTYGRSFRDLVRAFRRDYAHAPDLVAFPATSASWSRSWIGAIRTAPPRFRSGVGLAWLAVWSPTLVLATEGP